MAGVNLECRMYEEAYPEVDTTVMIQVKNITETGAYVSLQEYDNIEGMMLTSELTRRRFRSINSLTKVGRIEPAMVLRVDREKCYVDLSKRRVTEEDVAGCEERYNKSKVVHSILRHLAESISTDLEDLYIRIGWPLSHKYGHAFEAFKTVVTDPDSVLDQLTCQVKETGPDGQQVIKVLPSVTPEIKDALVKVVRRRMTPQAIKVRADIEMRCFHYDGVLHIKEAMRKAEYAGTKDCPVKIQLVAAPLYVLTTQTLDKCISKLCIFSGGKMLDQGISTLNNAITACTEEIERHKGKLVVKDAPRTVSERDDKLFQDQLEKLRQEIEDKGGDDDSDENDDDTDVDVENGGLDD